MNINIHLPACLMKKNSRKLNFRYFVQKRISPARKPSELFDEENMEKIQDPALTYIHTRKNQDERQKRRGGEILPRRMIRPQAFWWSRFLDPLPASASTWKQCEHPRDRSVMMISRNMKFEACWCFMRTFCLCGAQKQKQLQGGIPVCFIWEHDDEHGISAVVHSPG